MYLGDFATGATVRVWWNTNAIAGESITRATDGSIRIYKNGSSTQRSSSSGITDTEDVVTGVHRLSIDLSDNADVGFYAAGSDYSAVLVASTIDGKVVNHALAQFSIQSRYTPAVDLSGIPAAVWNYAVASFGAVTTAGGYIKSIIDAIKAKTDLLTQGNVTFTAPVNPNTNDLTVVRGDSYEVGTPRLIEWSSTDWAPYDLSSALSVTFKARAKYSETIFSKVGTALSDTLIRVELTQQETATFAVGRDAYQIEMEAVLANSDIVTLVLANMHVLADVR